jgi:WD40 repeat protein
LVEKEYIVASQALQERLQRELHRRRQRTVVGLVGGLVIAIILAAFALIQRSDAQKERQNALIQASIGLASQAQLELNGTTPERSVLLALEALENYPYTWQAEKALGQIVREFRLQDILFGHVDTISSAIWSPDGSKLATTGYDGTIRIWDGHTHNALSTIEAHAAYKITQTGDSKLAWSSDSTRIASAGVDKIVNIWDVETGKEILSFNRHNDALSGIAWSPVDNRVVTASKDGDVMVWDADTGKELFSLGGQAGWVMRVDWSPDGLNIATASDDATARIWDGTSGKELLVLSGHTNWVRSVDWSPDGKKLATASEDGTVRIWDALTGVELSDIRLATPVWQAAWSPDGLSLATSSASGLAQAWNVASGKEIFSLQGITEEQFDIAWSPDGKSLVTTGGEAASARIWNTLPLYLTLPAGPGQACWVSWSHDGIRIAVVYCFEKIIIIWNSWTGEKLLTITGHADEFHIQDVFWSPDGSKIVTTGWENLAKIWDANTGEELLTYTGHLGEPEIKFLGRTALGGGGWSPDGSKIITSGYSIQVWDAISGKQLSKFIPTTDLFVDARWSPDGKRVASCSPPEVLQIWDAATGAAIIGGYVHNTADMDYGSAIDTCLGAEWSPDGTRILTTSFFGSSATIWNASTGNKITVLKGHSGAPSEPTWSPNGMRVATGDTLGGIKVWDIETGSILLDYSVPVSDMLFQIAWSPDATRLAGAGTMNTVEIHRVWQTTEELIEYAKECCVFRELTDAEKTQFGLD